MTINKVKISEIADVEAGFAWKSELFSDNPRDGLPIIRIQNLGGNENAKFVYYKGEYEDRYIVDNENLLVSLSGSFKILRWDGPKALLNQRIVKLIPKESLVNKDYLYYYVSSKIAEIQGKAQGIAVANASMGTVRNMQILLPSISEQKNIVEILEKANELRKKRQEVDQLNNKMIQSIFLDMFDGHSINGDKWDKLTLPQIVSKSKHAIKRGPFGGTLRKEIFVDEGYLVYEQRHAIHEDFDFARYYITEKKYKELEMFKVVPGDLIISCSGVTLGKIAEIPKNAKPGIINQALLKISLHRTKVNNTYFKFLFRNKKIQDILFGISRGSGIPNFPPVSTIKKIKFPIPSIELQNKFADLVQKFEKIKEKQQESKQEYDNLFNALMKRSFA